MTVDKCWNWERCGERIASLRGRLGFPDTDSLDFLDLHLDLRSGILSAGYSGTPVPELRAGVFCILATYARAAQSPEAFRMVSFRELPGGEAYAAAFHRRAVIPLAGLYSRDPHAFAAALGILGGIPVAYADHAWKVHALPRVPLSVLVWDGSEEFPASAALFFDASAGAYLETEAAAMLGELAADRIAFLARNGSGRKDQGSTR